MTCPHCGADVPAEPIVDRLTVCQTCARCLVIEEGRCRYAGSEDIRTVSAAALQELRLRRPNAWRNDVRARHARIVGGR